MKKHVSARVTDRHGMGGFLNPPGHPEHTQSVETDLRRKPENRGSMSLSAAMEADYLDPKIRYQARRILERWTAENASATPDPKWVRQVLGYFRHCYRGPVALPNGEHWRVERLSINPERDPMAYPADHAGVNLIRKYYPGYEPTAVEFSEAKWGE